MKSGPKPLPKWAHLPQNSSRYLVHVEGQHKPLEGGHGGEPGVLLEVLIQVGQVEELVEAAVLIGDDVEQEAAVLFIGVDVVKHHHGVRMILGQHGLPRPSVDDVDVSLKGDAAWAQLSLCQPHAAAPGGGQGPANIHLLGTLKQPLPFLSFCVPLQGANLTRSHGEEGSLAARGLSLTWRTGPFREAPESAASL